MSELMNLVRVGATRKGKTQSAAKDVIDSPDWAEVILDPHQHSLAETIMTHVEGNVLFEKLSDVSLTLGFDFLSPSTAPDEARRAMENQQRGEAFCEILMRRRGSDGMAGTPLMEEWVMGAISLYLFQKVRLPLTILPSAFQTGSQEFETLVSGCTNRQSKAKFQQLAKMSPRAQRGETGSAVRLTNGVFRNKSFTARCRGDYKLGEFLQAKGKLVIERGEDIGDDAMRAIMGGINLLVIDHARRRPKPYPPIRIRIDEATNARLVGTPELHGIAETSKYGLYWEFMVQNLDFPGGADHVLQNCLRHEWFGCPFYELARKAAVDIVAGLPASEEESRADRISNLTTEMMNLPPGWRWVRDPEGSRKEYVPMLEHPWPDWADLRQDKLKEKLQWIYARPEYGVPSTQSDSTSSEDTPAPPPSSRKDSSPAERWKRGGKKPADGS